MPAIWIRSGNREVDNDESQHLMISATNSTKDKKDIIPPFRKPQVVPAKFKPTSIKQHLQQNENTKTIIKEQENSITPNNEHYTSTDNKVLTDKNNTTDNTEKNIVNNYTETESILVTNDNSISNDTDILQEGNTSSDITTISTIWKDCVEQLPDEHYAAKNFLHNINIDDIKDHHIELHVGGTSIKDILLPTIPLLTTAISKLTKQTCSISITVDKELSTNTESFIDYSNPEAILNNIIKENEAVWELKEKLNLHLV